MAEEGLEKTNNKLIHIGHPLPFDTDRFLSQMGGLMEAAYANREDIRTLVMSMVSTYHPAGRHGQEQRDKAHQADAFHGKRTILHAESTSLRHRVDPGQGERDQSTIAPPSAMCSRAVSMARRPWA